MRTNVIWFVSTASVLWSKISGRGNRSSAISFGLSRRDFRAMMCHGYWQMKSYQQWIQGIQKCFWNQSPSNTTVNRWYRHFRSGQTPLKDNDRCGRILTSATPQKNLFTRKTLECYTLRYRISWRFHQGTYISFSVTASGYRNVMLVGCS